MRRRVGPWALVAGAALLGAWPGETPDSRAHAATAAARVVLIRDKHPSFARFERELRRAYAGPIDESVVLTRHVRALPSSLSKLEARDIVVTVGRRAARQFARETKAGKMRCVARCFGVGPSDLRTVVSYDSFLSIQVSPEQRFEQLLRTIPEVSRVGVLVSSEDHATRRALRAVERLAGRELLEVQDCDAAHEAVSDVARFGEDVEVVMLLPDARTVPPRGGRLELEFLREVVKRDLWLVTFDHRQLQSRTVLSIEPDYVALARCLALAMARPRSTRRRDLRCQESLLRPVPDKLRQLRDKRKR